MRPTDQQVHDKAEELRPGLLAFHTQMKVNADRYIAALLDEARAAV